MCCILQAEELDVSGVIEEIKIAYSSLNWIGINTADLKNEADTALSFAKSKDINGLADFNKTNRMRRRKPKKLAENPDSAVTVDISQYYSKKIIAVLGTMLLLLREKYDNVESFCKTSFDLLDQKNSQNHPMDL